MCPKDDWKINYYVDADFCRLWSSENSEDPVVAKSWTGYILPLASCPLIWVSKLQTKVSVFTIIAEYVALSTTVRDMLPLKQLMKTAAKVVTGNYDVQVECHSDVFEDNNSALTVATTPQITPQSKFWLSSCIFSSSIFVPLRISKVRCIFKRLRCNSK